MSVLFWRMLVAWSLHRSVKRAALQQSGSQEKPLFRSSVAPFYKYKDHESSPNLGVIGKKTQKSERRLSRPPTASAAAMSNTSLFFSPTAGAAAGGVNAAGNRGSNYLPAGYYAAGASQPGNGQGMAHIGGNHNSISLSNLLPRDRYERASSYGPSPPGSPEMRPRGGSQGASRSTLNLNQAPSDQRAPSVFLDDLFDGEGAPPVPGHGVQNGRL